MADFGGVLQQLIGKVLCCLAELLQLQGTQPGLSAFEHFDIGSVPQRHVKSKQKNFAACRESPDQMISVRTLVIRVSELFINL